MKRFVKQGFLEISLDWNDFIQSQSLLLVSLYLESPCKKDTKRKYRPTCADTLSLSSRKRPILIY